MFRQRNPIGISKPSAIEPIPMNMFPKVHLGPMLPIWPCTKFAIKDFLRAAFVPIRTSACVVDFVMGIFDVIVVIICSDC